MTLYQLVEIKDGKSIVPVAFVGCHPTAWAIYSQDPPEAAFAEVDNPFNELLTAGFTAADFDRMRGERDAALAEVDRLKAENERLRIACKAAYAWFDVTGEAPDESELIYNALNPGP